MRADLARLEASATRYMKSKWWARAVETYEELVRRAPHNQSYRLSLAEAYLKMNRKLDAVRIYLTLIEPDTKDDISRVKEYVSAILAIDPLNTECHLRFGDILLKRDLVQDAKSQYLTAVRQFEMGGNFVRAAETLKKIVDLDPENPYIKVHLAKLHYNKGDTDEAVASLWDAARLLMSEQGGQDAITVLEQLLTLDPSHEEGLKALESLGGEMPSTSGNEGGRPEEKPAEEGPPGRDELLAKAAQALENEQVAKAAGTLERASTLYPKDPLVKVRLGEVYEKRSMNDDSVQAFWEAVQIYREIGERESAREVLLRLLKIDPGHSEAQMALAKIEVENAGKGTAKQDPGEDAAAPSPGALGEMFSNGAPERDAAQEEAPGTKEPLLFEQGIASMFGPGELKTDMDGGLFQTPVEDGIPLTGMNTQQVDQLLEEKGELDGEQGPLFHYQRGLAYLELGLLGEAVDELRMAAELPDKAADAYQLMGICYRSKGMLKSAISCFKAAMDSARGSDAGSAQLVQNLERLMDETALELKGRDLS